MTLRSLAFFLIPILLLGACHSSRPSEPEDNDTQRYDEAYAMANFLNEPRQAMLLIDSAFEAQNITDERRQYLKAIVMYNGFSHPDSSLLMCRHLVESDEWEEVTDTVLIVDVYSLMSTVAGTLNRHVDVIHYAQLAYDLVHGNPEFTVEENDFLSRVGRTQAFLGQKEEGLENIRQAYNNVKDTKSWPALMTSLNIGRKLANTLREMNRANEALPLIRELINKLEYFSAHTEEFSELQASMRQSRKAVDDYVDYLRVRCYGGLIRTFASLGVPDSARFWLNEMEKYKQADDPQIVLNLIPSMVKLRFDDRVMEDFSDVIQAIGSDTLDLEYVRLLEAMSDFERNRNNWRASNDYLRRASDVRDSIEQESFRSQLTDQLTIYQLHDERTNRIEAEGRNRRLFFISGALSLFLLLLTMIGVVLRIARTLRVLRRVHDDTRIELDEAKQKIEKLSKGYVPETPEQLYERIMEVMETKRPYTDQDFDIPQLASMVRSNRTYVSKVINRQSGMNFRTWLAKYRINLVQQYLKENPEASLDELCVIAGYASKSSLFRHFKSITGYTPVNWLISQEEEGSEGDSEES